VQCDAGIELQALWEGDHWLLATNGQDDGGARSILKIHSFRKTLSLLFRKQHS
jgi:hypothetical protein